MTFSDTASLALRNLRQAKLRTALTTMGVSIGIASLAGMVSLGVGLQNQLVGQFMQSGVFDSITVTSAADLPGIMAGGRVGRGGRGRGGLAGRGGRGGDNGGEGATEAASLARLDDDAIDRLRALPGVRDAYPAVSVPVQIALGDFSETMTAVGVPQSVRDEGAYRSMTAGTFFANEADAGCLLSLDAARRIDAVTPAHLVGQALTLTYAASRAGESSSAMPAPDAMAGLTSGGDPAAAMAALMQIARVSLTCPIVGIVERQATAGPFGGGGGVGNLMIPLALAKTISAENVTNVQSLLRQTTPRPRPAGYQVVTVKVTEAKLTQDVEDEIKKLGYSAFSLNDALQGAKRAFIVLDIVLSLIGSIALAVSSLGIVNTMVMSILERTREIGIMKAIGGSDADIRRIFLVEASSIGLMGGVLGVALGWLVGRVINLGANIYIESQGGTAATLFSLPLWLVASALGFSVAVSIIAGSYPANRAAKLEPMAALRHD